MTAETETTPGDPEMVKFEIEKTLSNCHEAQISGRSSGRFSSLKEKLDDLVLKIDADGLAAESSQQSQAVLTP
jgi:hypothetical protein